ncbi:uncharacterized protein DUF4397 [Natranaerovirga pectinivora]|uniref:Uncharacterized protein DUF4397 n=1 Tax=Natranaerovirga pectinivora TaxID=682400 RepID=A0A4R3MF37_9FIRM|nr:DUF4397 domain-containing protein [Natranaerovirga pectinivora]TCT12126.1 uncharacterized protein DUF4397 [Natranaerovirga pectinivora]
MWINPTRKPSCPYYLKLINKQSFGHPPTDLVVKPHTRKNSYLRFANFCTDTPEIDVYVENRPIAKKLRYGTLSMYATLSPGKHLVKIYAPDDKHKVYYSDYITIDKDDIITTFAFDQTYNSELIGFNDDVIVIPTEIFIRFINCSPDAPPLTFIINLEKTFSNISVNLVPQYKKVKINSNYDIIIQRSDTDEVIYNVPNIILIPGRAYTFYGIGIIDEEPPFQLVASLDGSSYFEDYY